MTTLRYLKGCAMLAALVVVVLPVVTAGLWVGGPRE